MTADRRRGLFGFQGRTKTGVRQAAIPLWGTVGFWNFFNDSTIIARVTRHPISQAIIFLDLKGFAVTVNKDKIIEVLSEEMNNIIRLVHTFRSRVAFSAWIGPIIVLGSHS